MAPRFRTSASMELLRNASSYWRDFSSASASRRRNLRAAHGKVVPLLERAQDRPDENRGKDECEDDHQAKLKQRQLVDFQRLENLGDKFHRNRHPLQEL